MNTTLIYNLHIDVVFNLRNLQMDTTFNLQNLGMNILFNLHSPQIDATFNVPKSSDRWSAWARDTGREVHEGRKRLSHGNYRLTLNDKVHTVQYNINMPYETQDV
jgi:hypothetical protein